MPTLPVQVPTIWRWELPAQSSVKQNNLKLKLCQKNFHLFAVTLQHDSPEVKVKPAFRWETSPEGSKTLALKFLTLS